jgi:hypothetical protein
MLLNETQNGNSQRKQRTRKEIIGFSITVVVGALIAQASIVSISGIIGQSFMQQADEITQTLLERWSIHWFGDGYVGINIMKTVAAGLIGCDALFAAFWLLKRLCRQRRPRAFPVTSQLAF